MTNRKIICCFIVISFVINTTKLLAFGNDTTKTKTIKLPKHYFYNCIYIDGYTTNKRTLDTVVNRVVNDVSKRLDTYKISQLALGFNIPVVTKDFYNKDSTRLKNLHFLLTGGITNLYLDFGGISEHVLSKTFAGFRGLYNDGRKSLFFIEVAPFITNDVGYRNTAILRLSTTVLYNCAVNDFFSFRVGYTRSFLYGTLSNLPYIGIRVGRLDKTNFSIQFPRSITLTIPAGNHIRTSLYAKPQGGFYTFSNHDSLALGNNADHQKLYFGRNEFLLGTRIDALISTHFDFYLSTGLTTQNNIYFYSTSDKRNYLYAYDDYKQKVKGGVFINFGMVFKYGKAKSIYNNQQMYNAVDINNNIDSGDNINSVNSEIPNAKLKMGKYYTDDVMDLMEAQDVN